MFVNIPNKLGNLFILLLGCILLYFFLGSSFIESAVDNHKLNFVSHFTYDYKKLVLLKPEHYSSWRGYLTYYDYYFLSIPERLCESTYDIFFDLLDLGHSKVVYFSQAYPSEAFLSINLLDVYFITLLLSPLFLILGLFLFKEVDHKLIVSCKFNKLIDQKSYVVQSSLFLFLISFSLLISSNGFDLFTKGFDSYVSYDWFNFLGLSHSYKLDGVSLVFIVLTTFLMMFCF